MNKNPNFIQYISQCRDRLLLPDRLLSSLLTGVALLILILTGTPAHAVVDGVTGPSFGFTARADHISTGDGDSVFIWGYALDNGPSPASGRAQYPGPTLIVNQGATVTITLSNTLGVPVSLVFPGQTGVTAIGGSPGLITREAIADDPNTPANEAQSVTYSFVASQPGTYLYHSGTSPELQMEMGLFGAIVVRPTGYDAATNKIAYGHPDTAYDQEYLFVLSEMDRSIHDLVEFGLMAQVDVTKRFPVLWFLNGRNAPDSMADAGVPWLPTQPYNSLPRTHPGEKLLMRVVSASSSLHPFHHHGNHARQIAHDGRLLSTSPALGPDLGYEDFTITAIPGQTVDAIFHWTGAHMGWDVYGTVADGPDFAHDCLDANADGYDDVDGLNHDLEWCGDHGKAIPVVLPNQLDLTFGGFWSGSPFLGYLGVLPPGEGGLNLNGGYFFMWHSHSEKEITTNDIFPGGMMTMVIIEPPGVVIP